MPDPRPIFAACLFAATAAVGCGVVGGRPVGDFTSVDSAERMNAIRQAADRNDRSAVPAMVLALESDDPAERMFAAEGLERMTGRTFGYLHYADVEQRAPAVARWKEWLKTQPAAKP